MLQYLGFVLGTCISHLGYLPRVFYELIENNVVVFNTAIQV